MRIVEVLIESQSKKYQKIKENYGERIIIGYLILAALIPFVAIMFLGGKNLTGAIFSLVCAVLSVLSMLDNILIVNLMTKVSEVSADCSWWRGKYKKLCSICAELRTKQVELDRELETTKCQLTSSKKATQDANQKIRHLEAELSRLKDSKPKSDKDGIEILKSLNKKRSNENGYSLFLHKCGPSKLQVVKIIKEHFHYDLKKVADLVNNTPCTIAENLSEDDANFIYNKLTNLGASVSIKC